jgi:hypothetical protein
MNNICLFVEGKSDVKFLKDYLNSVFNVNQADIKFDTLGGWAGYKAGGKLKTEIQQRFDEGFPILLVLDADKNCAVRRQEILNDFQNYDIPINLFLFPDNHNVGNLEDLLAEIAVNRKIMDCFLEFEKCVNEYPKPLNDSRIYAYLDMLLFPDKYKNTRNEDLRHDEFRDYTNVAHWDLGHPYLNPLREFFQQFI